MDAKIPVTVIVATLNEEKNLPRCLAALEDFDEIIVLDSNSTDKTPEIAASFGATLINFTWNGQYPKKRQWALDNLPLKHDRVFFIDADEEAQPLLCQEIRHLDWEASGYFVRGLYVSEGKILRHGIHNKKLCLFDRRKIEFPVVDDLGLNGMGEIEGHYQPVLKAGVPEKIPTLRNPVLHYALDDRERYTARHDGYTAWQEGVAARNAHPADPVKWRQFSKALYRRMPFKRAIFFLYYYIGRLGFLEWKDNAAIYREKQKYHVPDRKRA